MGRVIGKYHNWCDAMWDMRKEGKESFSARVIPARAFYPELPEDWISSYELEMAYNINEIDARLVIGRRGGQMFREGMVAVHACPRENVRHITHGIPLSCASKWCGARKVRIVWWMNRIGVPLDEVRFSRYCGVNGDIRNTTMVHPSDVIEACVAMGYSEKGRDDEKLNSFLKEVSSNYSAEEIRERYMGCSTTGSYSD